MNISRELKAQCAQTIRELLNNQKLKDEDRAKLIKYTLNKFFEKHKVEYAQDKRNVAKSILLGNGTSEGVEDSLFRNALLKQLPMTSSFMYESIDYERGIYTVGWDKGQLKGTYKHHSPDDLVNLVKRVNDSFTKIYGPSGKVDNRSNKRTWGTEFTCCKEEELGLEYSNAHMWMSDRGEKVLKDKKLYYWRDSAGNLQSTGKMKADDLATKIQRVLRGYISRQNVQAQAAKVLESNGFASGDPKAFNTLLELNMMADEFYIKQLEQAQNEGVDSSSIKLKKYKL